MLLNIHHTITPTSPAAWNIYTTMLNPAFMLLMSKSDTTVWISEQKLKLNQHINGYKWSSFGLNSCLNFSDMSRIQCDLLQLKPKVTGFSPETKHSCYTVNLAEDGTKPSCRWDVINSQLALKLKDNTTLGSYWLIVPICHPEARDLHVVQL